MRMTSMESQAAALTSACWPTATRRGPAAAALASAWAVMENRAKVSNGERFTCLLGRGVGQLCLSLVASVCDER